MTDAEKIDLARRFFAAVERGDLETVRSLYAPDAKIWTAQDPAERSPEENLAVLTWVKENVRDFRYEEVRCQPTPTGFVEQHVTSGTAPGGGQFRFPACLVVRVENGKVTRLDEYFDTAPLMAAMSQVQAG